MASRAAPTLEASLSDAPTAAGGTVRQGMGEGGSGALQGTRAGGDGDGHLVKQYHIVATDLDGTFLGENPRGKEHPDIPTEENKRAFHELSRRGVHLAMISGRCYTTTSVMMDHCELDHHVISCHGATIYGPKRHGEGGKRPLVKAWPLSDELLRALARTAEKTDTLLVLYTSEGLLSCGNPHENLTFKNARGEPVGEWWARVGEFPIPHDGHPVFEALPDDHKDLVRASPLVTGSRNFATFGELLAHVAEAGDEVYKGILVTDSGRVGSACDAARAEIAPELGNVMGPFEHWVEVIHPEVNKAVAVRWLAESVGTTIDHTVALGDGLNDIEMLKQAGHGIAMANAVAEAKAVARLVSDHTNDESAVAREIERLTAAGMFPDPLE